MSANSKATAFLLRQQIPSLHGDLKDQAQEHLKAVDAESEIDDLDRELAEEFVEVLAAGNDSSLQAQERGTRRNRRARRAPDATDKPDQNQTTTENPQQ